MCDAGLTGGKGNSSKTPDVYKFDEDSSDAVSPEQPSSQEAPSSSSASPGESGGADVDSSSTPVQVEDLK